MQGQGLDPWSENWDPTYHWSNSTHMLQLRSPCAPDPALHTWSIQALQQNALQDATKILSIQLRGDTDKLIINSWLKQTSSRQTDFWITLTKKTQREISPSCLKSIKKIYFWFTRFLICNLMSNKEYVLPGFGDIRSRVFFSVLQLCHSEY